MHFGFLNYRVGIVFCEDMTTKIAVLRKTCKGHVLVWSALFADGARIYLPGKFYSCPVVLSLKGPGLLLRTTFSSLKNKKQAKQLAENSLEHTLPFPPDSIFTETTVFQKKTDQTLVSSWITTKERIASYFDRLKKISLRADDISCEPEAFIHLLEPEEERLSFLVVSLDGEISCTLLKGRHPLATRSFEKRSLQENANECLTTLNHMLNSYPKEEELTIKLWDMDNDNSTEGSETLLQLIQSQTQRLVLNVVPLTRIEGLQPDSWKLYGSAIAAAYHGFSSQKIQFKEALLLSKQRSKFLLRKIASPLAKLALSSLILVSLTASYKKMSVRKEIQENLFSLGENFILPRTSKEALNQIKKWKETQQQQCKDYPYVPNGPGIQHVLAFFSDFAKTPSGSSIKISHLSYDLNSFPTEETPHIPYSSTVQVKGSGSKEALQKLKALLRSPSLPFSASNLAWKESGETFELSFTPEINKGRFS
ncbi:hypothetical protein [Chlamydiifrater phoenicopteri]|uniref:hypothetical protein n=1 Tax=Chlamydiifrater phoenicopteri TaxID=2681469 RepID=UPI001BCCAA59|nr:hypothetical protein [Chlamydiifrater phoenicopteri]